MNGNENDIALVHAFKSGDQRAEEQVFNLFFRPLCLFADGFTGQVQAAEDIVTEAFLKLFNRRNEFAALGNIKAFLYVAVRNAGISYVRTEKRHETAHRQILATAAEDAFISDNATQNEIIRAEVIAEIYNEIERLPVKCRDIFKLLYFQGLGTDQIARQLGISTQTVRTQKARAIQLIRTELLRRKALPALLVFASCLQKIQ